MKWDRVGLMGMQSGEYRVGKFLIERKFLLGDKEYLVEKFVADEGALCTLYTLHYKHSNLGTFNSFDECKEAALKHKGVA